MTTIKPKRYGKPNMADLPPELGRMVIEAIRNSQPFDFSKLDAECERVERELAKMGREENASKSVFAGK